MSLRCRVSGFSVFVATLLISGFFVPFSEAQQPTSAGKVLTVERIYSQQGLSGRLTRGLEWTSEGKQLSASEAKGTGRDAKTEFWGMHDHPRGGRFPSARDKQHS